MSGRLLSIGVQSGLTLYCSVPLSSTSGSDSTPTRKSHYRPFSTLHIHPPCTPTPPGIRRSVSVGGLHSTMGLQFASKGRKEVVRANSPASLSDGFSSLRLTKKRSMPLIFAAPEVSPSPCPDELPVIDISKNHVSYEDLDVCNNFVAKNIWAKRCNMKLHPFHEQVVYMQAYDPISLE